MPEISKLSLNAGELSDELAGRIDLQKFNTGCEILENARVLRAGGITRRSGLEYVGGTYLNGKARLVGFQFAETQGYALEFTDKKMRVIQNGVIDAAVYTTPWTEDQIFQLQFAQRIDRIIVTHPEVSVRNIIKYNDGTWGLVEHPWQTRVWNTYPTDDTITMAAGAISPVGASTTITSSTAIFLDPALFPNDNWVGDRIRIDHTVSESYNEYTVNSALGTSTTINLTNTNATDGDIHRVVVDGQNNFYLCIADYAFATDLVPTYTSMEDYIEGNTNGNPIFFQRGIELVAPQEVSAGWVFETFGTWTGTYWVQRSEDEGTNWATIKVITSADNRNERLVEEENEDTLIRVLIPRFENDYSHRASFTTSSYTHTGSALVTARNSDTEVQVTIEKSFFSTTASSLWYEAAFSPRNGYPAACTFYQSRLVLGGTDSLPQTFWMSKTQNPFDFTLGTLATDGMAFETDAGGYERITWLSSHLSLLVGTTLGVWAASSPDGNVITPESNRINRQMQVGAQKGFQAVPLQNNVLFLQNKGRKVQELTGGSVEYGGYLAADLTQLATQVTRGGITQIATGELPDASLFMVNGGEISVLTYERAQNVVGWSRWKTGGDFESFTTTNGAGEEDDHYAVVNRGGNRYIEYLTPDMLRIEEDNDVENLRFLDCYTETISGTDIDEVTGLTRFANMEVDTFIDGEPHGAITVSAGGVATLPRGGKNVVIGLPYTTEVRPLSIDFGAIASKSAIIEILIRFRNSLGGEVSQDRLNWSTVEQLQPRITTDTPLSLLSQDYQSTPHSTWERKPSISVRQTQPLPMTILAMRLKTKSSK